MRYIFGLTLLLIFAVSLPAQTTRVKIGGETVAVKGTVINTIEYNFQSGKARYVAYRYRDRVKKSLVISEVQYEFENGKPVARSVETYTCPLDKISKDKSNNLEMEDEAVADGRYWRLTLVADGTGADNLYFRKQSRVVNEKPKLSAVNFVTINVADRTAAEKLLVELTR